MDEASRAWQDATKCRLDSMQMQLVAQAELISDLKREVQALKQPPKNENYYQNLLEQLTNGKHMHIPGIGRTDVTTNDAHMEIKRWHRYQEVPGQLAKYQSKCPRPRSVVYFFGSMPSNERVRNIQNLMVAHGIEMNYFDDYEDTIHRVEMPSEKEPDHLISDWITDNIRRSPSCVLSQPACWKRFHAAHPAEKQKDLYRELISRIGCKPTQQDAIKRSRGWAGFLLKGDD